MDRAIIEAEVTELQVEKLCNENPPKSADTSGPAKLGYDIILADILDNIAT
jgi:hypothetical protein